MSGVRIQSPRATNKGRKSIISRQDGGTGAMAVKRQQKVKEEREAKKSQFDSRHYYIIDTVADSLGLEQAEAVEFILDGVQIEAFTKFFEPYGSAKLMFFFQEEISTDMDLKRQSSMKPALKQYRKRLFITDGTDAPLRGQCLFFVRINIEKAIVQDNIQEMISFHILDPRESGLLTSIEQMMTTIFLPVLSTMDKGWGELQGTSGREVRGTFVNNIESFIAVLRSAQSSLEDSMSLAECKAYDLSILKTPNDFIAVANSSESMEKIEGCIAEWIKQISQVLAESEQMRREDDNVGPRAELEYWKKRMAKFNFLVDQLKSKQVRTVLCCLQAAKSKTVQTWLNLDRKITNLANEAKDNVKYLYTLEKFCDPLYNSDPVSMVDAIPGLINSIRMIHSISQFYNTSERMTALFSKVTNQMITACKSYITCNGVETIWSQDREELLEKLRVSIKLNKEYQLSFQLAKQRLERTPDERQFDFSEMYVFGKFDSFVKRLDKIMEMFTMMEIYSHLKEAPIEGMETFSNKYLTIVTSMKNVKYDFLDSRRIDFDNDFEDFQRKIGLLQDDIKKYMDSIFDKVPNIMASIKLAQKFERLRLPKLAMKDVYERLLHQYGREIEHTAKLYQRHKSGPTITNNFPPVAGKIMWSRQLFHRIQEPMDFFQENQSALLETADAKKVIRNYNKLAKVLMEYELLYHNSWTKQIDLVKSGLSATLLVKHPDTQELYVNFDPDIFTLIRESECMIKLNLAVPGPAQSLLRKRNHFNDIYTKLECLLADNRSLRASIPNIMRPLFVPHLMRIDKAMEPGLIKLTWTSINIEDYYKSVKEVLDDIKLLINRCQDLMTHRIEGVLNEMTSISLLELPEDEAWTVDHFLSRTKYLAARGAHILQLKSRLVEEACHELISMIMTYDDPHLLEIEEEEEDEEYELGALTDEMLLQHYVRKHSLFVGEFSNLDDEEGMEEKPQTADRKRQSKILKKKIELKQQLEDEAYELLNHLEHRNIDALVRLTRMSLDQLKKRIATSSIYSERSYDVKPFFRADITLCIPKIIMVPSLDEIQQSVNNCIKCVLSVSKGISQWSKERKSQKQQEQERIQSVLGKSDVSESAEETKVRLERRTSLSSVMSEKSVETLIFNKRIEIEGQQVHIMAATKNYFKNVAEQNKEIIKLLTHLNSSINSNKKEVLSSMDYFNVYKHLWHEERENVIIEFERRKPTLQDFISKIVYYRSLEEEIDEVDEFFPSGPVALYTEKMKLALKQETKNWMLDFSRFCNKKYKADMDEIFFFIEDQNKKLSRDIKDLDDIRTAMDSLADIRENEIRLDMKLGPVEECYAMLSKYDLPVSKEELERIDTLRYSWDLLRQSAYAKQCYLTDIQPRFKGSLLDRVEQFNEDTALFYEDYDKKGPLADDLKSDPRSASDALLIFQNRFDALKRSYETYTRGEQLFGLPQTEYPRLMAIEKEIRLLSRLYGLYNSVMDSIDGYKDILWVEVDIEKINTELTEFQNRCRKLPKGLKDYAAFNELKRKIDGFTDMCPLLEMMANKAMKPRHWERISKLVGKELDIESDQFSMKNILECDLHKFKEDIEDICIAATKEKDIEAKLKTVEAEWNLHVFTFTSFKNRGELLLRGDNIQEIMNTMEDSLMTLGSLLSNRYNAPFKKKIQKWIQDLSNTSDIIENWMTVQNLWVYLEAVFVGGDIAKQLPQEAKRFSNIDKSYVKIMTRAHETINVVACCVGDDTLGQLLPHLLEQLELCQKSLTGYLEKKRLAFPRFFFVSDPTLLEILGQASDPQTIQNHLLSIFDNTKSVRFHEKNRDLILSIMSSEKETIELEKPVKCEGNVERWLMSLLVMAQQSLHGVIRAASVTVNDSEFNLIEFLNLFPAQIGILGIQLIWTRDSTEALANAKFDRKIMQAANNKFLELLKCLISQTTKDLESVGRFERRKYETLITIHVHQRDIFNELCQNRVRSPADFEWLKQCRFYFVEDTDKLEVRITDVCFLYQNEFIGCVERLVITPLTDRCYITLSQALGMSMGGAPAGPAGTGKTETTKDMGRCLGKYVVVFNCSDQMDFRGLGRIYKGLAQSGSWGCFDEFNRIELPVLSVAAQQIAIVLNSRKERKKQFTFTDGDLVDLNPEFGLFITMNPGYAGRQELPENLKIMFRTVAMMVPDRQIIIRVKLASCGFHENIELSAKFYTLYKLCEEQLSKQVHYDFGLRNILSVLRTLGAEKRKNPNDPENKTVMRVLRDMNLSKLIDEDEPLFLSLIDDLFPGITLDTKTYPELQHQIEHRVREGGIINHPAWNLKVIQLFETQRVRWGIMALGPTGAGKTTCINTLLGAFSDGGEPHREMRMNPKAITAPQMFGRLDAATNDWTDGIFSTLWRKTHKVRENEHIWIVLDGPVDAIWIENLNSVLDDNKTLTLANGDRIPMATNCKVIFEPDNIDNASPATVSRNGMVFMSSSVLTWDPILSAWLRTRKSDEAAIIHKLFNDSFDEIYKYSLHDLEYKMKVLECIVVVQMTRLMEGLIPRREERDAPSASKDFFNKLYIYCIMWSIGAFLEWDARSKLETFLRTHQKFKSPLDLPVCEASHDTMFDYFVNPTDGTWRHWSHVVETYTYPSDHTPEYNSILVPNVDNVRTDNLIDTITKQGRPVLLIGEQGTAKTVMITSNMKRKNPEAHLVKSFNFSSATLPLMFQRTIESYIDKRMGSQYGPPAGKKMTVFIDDINMPIINEWGDQVTNEIVRQTIEMGGFYNLEKPGDFTSIVDVHFIAAMIHPGGGRNDIPMRLKRHFSIFNCTLPANPSIDKIFTVIATGHYCKARGFAQPVRELAGRLVPITRRLWQLTKVKMLPTPAKFHYVFNLRDLSRIWQGVINTISEAINTETKFLCLWKHECQRVISDRFLENSDTKWFLKCLERIIDEELGETYKHMLDQEMFFVDFLRDAPEATGDEDEDFNFDAPKVYEPIPSFQALKERLNFYMGQYNEQVRGAGLDLVFFTDAMTHLMRISRIIRTPQGNALLVGVGGSGKQSLTRLASFIAGYRTFQITLTRSYNATNLMEDLKILYRTAGQKGDGMSFIFTDQEIKDEGFLEYFNNLLSSGEISNLFQRDEIDEICGELIPIMKKEFPRRPPTPESLYDYFISRARKNLHVVLCFSPVGEKFRNRSLKFPGLISGCTINWFQRWPKDALIAVSRHFIQSFHINCEPNVKNEVIESMGLLHDGVANTCTNYFQRFRRATHVTPKSYLSFIGGYKRVYEEKIKEINNLASRMNIGLKKLVEAGQSCEELSKELFVKEQDLQVANIKADKVLQEVKVSASATEAVKAEAQSEADKALQIKNVILEQSTIAEEKLKAAKPALDEAERALSTIKAADIATVKKLAKPPFLITIIMDCVSLLFQRRLDPISIATEGSKEPMIKASWGESLKVMGDSKFLFNLQNFDKDGINEEMIELMQPYLEYCEYSFERAKQVCGDVAGLLSWTVAMTVYYSVNKEVIPLKDNLAVMTKKRLAAELKYNEASEKLAEKEAELRKVQAVYDKAMKEKQDLMDDADRCRRKMDAASNLIDGLSGERKRWTEQSKEFKSQSLRLVGDVLLGSAFLSYAGPFNQEYRRAMLKHWQKDLRQRKIPFTTDLNLIDMLTDPATIGEWNLQGLPNDELSIQNGIIVTKAPRYPLLVDPQTQGKQWIKAREVKNELQITSLNHKYFRTHLEDALSLGRPLLIEDIGEELDPALDNVLEKNFIKIGSSLKVKVGDKETDIMEGFMIYLTTKLPNPVYTPEISAKTCIIDFTVTMKGLEDQLLGRVILSEKAELEDERTKLMEDVTSNKRVMQDLEDNLLLRLTSTEGSLVDDESLINVLRDTKKTSEEVTQKLQVAAETSQKINFAREEFRPVATRGSTIYFLICEMSNVDSMYQTSLKQFLEKFDESMERSEKSLIASKRMNNIIEFMTFEIWAYTARGLYETHKFLFTLLLTLKIDLQSGKVKQDEMNVLIKGGASRDIASEEKKPGKWIQDTTWLNLIELSELQTFQDITNQVTRNEKEWRRWFDKEFPEEEVIPDGYEKTLDHFRRLLLIRSWCMDRTMAQAKKYINDSQGERFAEGVILDLEKLYAESVARSPLICFLSMGSDPTGSIELLAKKKGFECRSISMGQGQEIPARKVFQQLTANGGWILLQNTHLSLDFMREVTDIVTEQEVINDDFRLWMTTEPHPKFPITLLQMCLKFTNEPPQGIKPGLRRTFASLNQDFLDYTNAAQWKPMLFAVAFLHTAVQERRKFGPIGWNIPYEFNSADFTATVQFVQNHLDDMDPKKGVQWSTVRYMIGEIQYGGRVTDDFDKILLNTFARTWFKEDMFQSTFKFYKGYTIPQNCKTIVHYQDFISSLPTTDTPEAFGLHINADITYQTSEAQKILESILNIQPKDTATSGTETRETIVERMAKEFLDKLPPNFDMFMVKEQLNKLGAYQPLNIFLRQEIDRMQSVIKTVRATLTDLCLAIDGTIIMNESLRDALDCMFDARIPNNWLKISWQSSTLGFWFTELQNRNAQFSEWIGAGRPISFWLTGFFNPQGFLTAMRQEVTRAHKGWALDSVVICNEVLKVMREELAQAPVEGVYIYGLFLEGAAWDRKNSRLTEQKPKQLFDPLPVMLVSATLVAERDNKLYQCPIYKKPRRTDQNFIAAVELKCSSTSPPDHWILRGVALLCDIK